MQSNGQSSVGSFIKVEKTFHLTRRTTTTQALSSCLPLLNCNVLNPSPIINPQPKKSPQKTAVAPNLSRHSVHRILHYPWKIRCHWAFISPTQKLFLGSRKKLRIKIPKLYFDKYYNFEKLAAQRLQSTTTVFLFSISQFLMNWRPLLGGGAFRAVDWSLNNHPELPAWQLSLLPSQSLLLGLLLLMLC